MNQTPSSSRPLRIALLGTRGIPAAYGGFETFAEELSVRLGARGHHLLVYGRRRFFEESAGETSFCANVRTVKAPTVFHKYFETPLHSFTSFLDLMRREIDVVLLCNAANAPFAFLATWRGIPVAVNVDGIERKRAKWNSLGRLWYRLGEWSSVRAATKVVADADVIADYYRERYGIESAVIAYGADGRILNPGPTLVHFGLQPRKYLLYVSRLEPENNALGVVQAYSRVKTDLPLVVVGDAPYAGAYIEQVKQAADSRVIFTGYQFGDAYRELQSHCLLYLQATEVGGTHPALIEAMSRGCAVVANQVPEHEEVLGDGGWYYPKNDFVRLGELLQELLRDPEALRSKGDRAKDLARQKYSWDAIASEYEGLLESIARCS